MVAASIESNVKEKGEIGRWLFNPFYYLAGVKAMIIGIIVILITALLALAGNFSFKGVIGFSVTERWYSPFWHCITDVIIPWLLLSILLLIAGKVTSKSRIRIIDVFGTQALARFPYLFLAFAAVFPGVMIHVNQFIFEVSLNPAAILTFSADTLSFVFILLIYITMTIWMVVLMMRAFMISCNVASKKAKIAFIICLLIGHIGSVHIISHIPIPYRTSTTANSGQKAKASRFITLLSEGDYRIAEGMFDETMKDLIPEEILKKIWESNISQTGPLKFQGAITKEKIEVHDQFYYVVKIPCQFERCALDYMIVFNNDGMIAGLHYENHYKIVKIR